MVINFGTGLGVVIYHNAISACVISRVGRGVCCYGNVVDSLRGLCLWLHKTHHTKENSHTLFPGKGKRAQLGLKIKHTMAYRAHFFPLNLYRWYHILMQ